MRTFFFILSIAVSFSFSACSSSNTKTSEAPNAEAQATQPEGIAEVLSAADFQAKLSETSNALLLDVRTPGEVEQGHIANASFIDFNGGDFQTKIGELNKEQPVFLYCAGGTRSGKARKMMQEMGFKEVYDLDGGMGSWNSAGMEVVKP